MNNSLPPSRSFARGKNNMSGGSFDYLYCKFRDMQSHTDNLGKMADRLAVLGYKDAAREAHRLLADVRKYEARMDAYEDELAGIFQAVEWYDSCDWDPEQVEEAIQKWRGNKPKLEKLCEGEK